MANKRLSWVLIVGLACLSLGMGCNAHGVDSRQKVVDWEPVTEEPKGLTLRIESDKQVYQEDEDIILTYAMKNTNKQPFMVPSHVESYPEEHDWVWLYLTPSNGSKVYMLLSGEREYNRQVAKVLQPQETYKRSVNIKEWSKKNYNIIRFQSFLGTYDVYAVYEVLGGPGRSEILLLIPEDDGELMRPKPEIPCWVGTITSNTISITIKPNKDK